MNNFIYIILIVNGTCLIDCNCSTTARTQVLAKDTGDMTVQILMTGLEPI